MADDLKKYISLARLSNFLDNIKAKYSQIGHEHTVSDLTDYKVDDALSSTSTNPVQNKVIDAEFEAISDAMSALDSAIDDKVDKSTIIDNLTSTSTDKPLSANQGKILQDQIAEITSIPDSEIIALFST